MELWKKPLALMRLLTHDAQNVYGQVRMRKKVLALLRLLTQDPQNFFDQVSVRVAERYELIFGQQPVYVAIEWESILEELRLLLPSALEVASEPELGYIESQVRQRLATVDRECATPFSLTFNADPALARCCYVACRLLNPSVIVESGVAYGVSSAFILKALEKNGGHGKLYSVELPPLDTDGNAARFVGCAIPDYLRSRWALRWGTSKRVLPGLLKELEAVGLFVQDSLHTYRNMRREFAAILPYMSAGGMIIADDVEGNRAFEELRRADMQYWQPVFGEVKRNVFGVGLLR